MSAITTASIYTYPLLGDMTMPADFHYKNIFFRGRPRHDPMSRFRLKHPEIPCSRRAKIFAPFDALRGFNEAVASKEVLYTGKPLLSEYEKEKLDASLAILRKLTFNNQAARQNAAVITVTYYLVCSDEENDSYGTGGTLETVTGICSRIDSLVTHTITVGGQNIPLDDVIDITGEALESNSSAMF